MMYPYVARPIHLTYAVILFLIGVPCFIHDTWFWFGVAMWVLAAIVTGWIVIAGIIAERSRYWDSVAGVLKAAAENDIEKLAALGFRAGDVPSSIHVDMRTDDTTSRHFD